MTAKTHKQFAICWVYLGAIFIYNNNISEVNYYLMVAIMIAFGEAGALFPDIDHTWRNVKDKTTVKWILNKIIHATGGRHRSWQTHSWDICILFTGFCYLSSISMYDKGILTKTNFEVLNIITSGFNLGWISHLFSDMLTSSGVRIFSFSSKKVALVPKYVSRTKLLVMSIGLTLLGAVAIGFNFNVGWLIILVGLWMCYLAIKLGNIRFNTGKEWEAFVYKVTKTINRLAGILVLVYPILDDVDIKEVLVSLIGKG